MKDMNKNHIAIAHILTEWNLKVNNKNGKYSWTAFVQSSNAYI